MTLSGSFKKYIASGSHKASEPDRSSNSSKNNNNSSSNRKTRSDSSSSANNDHLSTGSSPGLTRTSSALSKNDPLYESESINSGSSANNGTAYSTLNLNQKSMPNDIQRQQRNQPFKKLPLNMNKLSIVSSSSSSSSIGTPIAKHLCSSPPTKHTNTNTSTSSTTHSNSTATNISTLNSGSCSNNNNSNNSSVSKNTCCCSSSPVDIFERNVQYAEIPTEFSSSPLANNNTNEDLVSANSRPQSRSRSHLLSQSSSSINNPYILSNCRPRHLFSENYTSPVLDSTVELISSEKFDDTDVVEVPHARASQQLFKSHSHVSNSSISGSSSPRMSISRKYSNTNNSFTAKNPVNLDHIQTSFSHNRSKSSLSNLSSPLVNTKSEPQCTCNNANTSNNNPINADSPLVSPHRKSISFYSYLDLLDYERMSNNNNNINGTSPSPPYSNNDFIRRQNDIYDAQEEADDLRDLKNAQMLENQLTGDLLTVSCPKHGVMTKRMARQGCLEDGDAKIDEELNTNSPQNDNKNNTNTNTNTNIDGNKEATSSGDSRSPVYHVFNTSSSAIVDDDYTDANQEDGDDDEQDGSIQSWIPVDNDFCRENSRSRSRHQSIVEEMASLKSCTTNNSYFEDELQQCSTHDTSSRLGAPLVNVCSASDYLSSRTRELRNSFVCSDTSLTPKKLLN